MVDGQGTVEHIKQALHNQINASIANRLVQEPGFSSINPLFL